MKNINLVLLLLAGSLLIGACKKNEMKPARLEGSWELRHILGVQVAGAPSDYARGNGDIIKFKGNKYQRFLDGEEIFSGTFEISEGKADIDGTRYSSVIVFDGKTWQSYIKIEGKKLRICSGTIAADGTTMTYEKM